MPALTTWQELRRDLAAAHKAAAGAYDSAADNLMHGATHAEVFPDLAADLFELRTQLDRLVTLMAESDPPPDRSLDAVLADIEAEGYAFSLNGYSSESGSFNTWLRNQDPTTAASEWMSDSTHGKPLATAEARLEQIKALRAEYARRLERDGLAADVPDRVKRAAMDAIRTAGHHYCLPDGTAACGGIGVDRSDDIDAVTCQACLSSDAVTRASEHAATAPGRFVDGGSITYQWGRDVARVVSVRPPGDPGSEAEPGDDELFVPGTFVWVGSLSDFLAEDESAVVAEECARLDAASEDEEEEG